MLRVLHAAGDYAVCSGFYAGAAVLLLFDLLNASAPPAALAATVLLAMSVYLLDRVKPADAMLDPADAVAHPRRYARMRRHPRAIRTAVVVLGGAAIILAWTVHPVAALAAPLAHVGVLVYGSLPRRPRVKDVLFVKNAAVAVSITALAVGLWELVNAGDERGRTMAVAFTGGFLLLHVFADCMLCDLDDDEADARFGTRTWPNVFGRRATWVAVAVINVAATGLAAVGVALDLLPVRSLAYAAGLAVTLPALLPLVRRRDAVDLRLPVVVGGSFALANLL